MHGVHFCFNGQEIKNRLIGHLNHAFCQIGINTTFDDHQHTRGEEVSQSTLKAIEKSWCSIVVFCCKFAFSPRCLDELNKILDCEKRNGQLVRPLFFQIDQSEVENLEGSYGEALAGHREKFKNERMKVERWVVNLHDAANLPGWTFKTGCESKFIQTIVKEISEIFKCNGLQSPITEPQTLLDPGSCDDVDTVGKNGIAGIGAKCNVRYQKFPNEAQLKRFFTSSLRKESKNEERFTMVKPSTCTTSTSKEKGEFLGPKMSGIVQHNELLNGHLSVEIDTKRRRILNGAQFNIEAHACRKQTCSEITGLEIFDTRANDVLVTRVDEDDLVSREVDRNRCDFALNDAIMEAIFASLIAESTSLSASQGTETVSMRTSEEVKSAMQTLQTCVSKKFCELVPEGSKFMEYIQNNVLSFSAEQKISPRMGLIVEKLLFYFTHWSRYYEDADTKLKTSTADLSKVAEVEKDFRAVVNESKKAVCAEKEACIQLDHMLCRKRELEEQLKAVTAEISDLSSSCQAAAARKRLLLDKGSKLKTEKDKLMVQLPRLRAEQATARFTQENIETEWLKLGKVFSKFLMSEFDSV